MYKKKYSRSLESKMWIAVFLCLNLCIFVSSLPNFVLILTDDQDLNLGSMAPMKRTIELIADQGTTFAKAYTNSPICCPSRSTILTGKFLHNVQVKNNSISGNCSSLDWQNNHEPFTVANILKKRGNYNTFYAGKYLNQYGANKTGGLQHVPQGYDWWIGLEGNSKYYNYTLSINGSGQYFKDNYLTDVMKNYALNFLNQTFLRDLPFFMILSPPAAHAPFTPAPRHKGKYAGVKAPTTPSFNYSSPDKHWLVTMLPKHLPTNVSLLDEIYQSRLETLLAVDEMVDDLFKKLNTIGVINNTYVIFTSDHGFHIGQFAQPWDKRQPYETDIHIPLLVRGPGVLKQIFEGPVSLVDLVPTVLELAEIEIPKYIDGKSFAEILNGGVQRAIQDAKYLFVEYHGEGQPKYIDSGCPYSEDLSECSLSNWCKCQDARNNTYTCVKLIMESIDLKYCRFYDDLNFREAYDLIKDPYELVNIYNRLNKDLVKRLEDVLDEYLVEK